MDTMRYREKKKKYTFQSVSFVLFILGGIGFTTFAICNEKEPAKIGTEISNLEFQKGLDEETNSFVDIYKEEIKEEKNDIDLNGLVAITNKIFSNSKDKKVNASIKVPVITINSISLDSLNNSVYEKFNKNYVDFKDAMKDVNNTFTYNVNYEYYLNNVNSIKVLSVIIHEQMIDNKIKRVSKDKKYTYNINIDTKEIIKQEDITDEILGSKYKDIIKENINKVLTENKILNKDDAMYSYTELEPYYIKDNKFHIIFNPLDVNEKLNRIIDIEMEKK